jgi:hypothetical protein
MMAARLILEEKSLLFIVMVIALGLSGKDRWMKADVFRWLMAEG